MRPLLTFCMRPFKCIHNESLSHLCASRANNSVPCVALLHAHHWHMCKDYRRHKNLRRHKDCRQHKEHRQNERRHIHMHTPCAGTADIQRFLGYYVQERERFLHCRTFDRLHCQHSSQWHCIIRTLLRHRWLKPCRPCAWNCQHACAFFPKLGLTDVEDQDATS